LNPSNSYARVIYELEANKLARSKETIASLSSLLQKCKGQYVPSLTFSLIDQQIIDGNLGAALDESDKLIAGAEKNGDPESQQRAWLKRGEILSRQGEQAKALQAYAKATEIGDPTSWRRREAEYCIATTFLLMGNLEEARAHYVLLKAMIVSTPQKNVSSTELTGLRKLGMLEASRGDLKSAEQEFRWVANLSNTNFGTRAIDKVDELIASSILLLTLEIERHNKATVDQISPGLDALIRLNRDKYRMAKEKLEADCALLKNEKYSASVRNQLHE
jgi:Flp pilus assembly protein TadD